MARRIFIYATHGTYGRDDDAFGAMLAANSALAKGFEVTLALVDDGAPMAMKGQSPGGIGLPNNQDEIQDFVDLGGWLVVSKEAMDERGITEDELVDEAEIMNHANMNELLDDSDITMTY